MERKQEKKKESKSERQDYRLKFATKTEKHNNRNKTEAMKPNNTNFAIATGKEKPKLNLQKRSVGIPGFGRHSTGSRHLCAVLGSGICVTIMARIASERGSQR
jgi:hypothetical protein